jgi:hypothetical protein
MLQQRIALRLGNTSEASGTATPVSGDARNCTSNRSSRGCTLRPSPLADAAKALGMTEAELKTELQAGKSIADVAKAKNVDLDEGHCSS